MAKKHAERQDQYFQVHQYMAKTDAWLFLSAAARAVYIQIGLRYNGSNNGKIPYSVRDAAQECNIARNSAMRALHELVELGFIEETRHGSLSKKTRIASEWRLTAFRCDLTGAVKTCAFMQRGTAARAARERFRRPQEPGACLKRRPRVSQTTAQPVANDGTVEPPSVSNDGTLRPVLGGEPVANDGTLLIYQSARSPREDGPRTNDGEAAQHANIANLPWSSPRWVEITPEIDEALNRVLDGRSRLGLPAPVDALTEIEGLILSKTLTHGSAVREAVH